MAAIRPVFANGFSTTFASDIASGAVTSWPLTSTTGLPALGTNEFLRLIVTHIDTGTNAEVLDEVAYATAIAAGTATVLRGQEGTTAGALTAATVTVSAAATAVDLTAWTTASAEASLLARATLR